MTANLKFLGNKADLFNMSERRNDRRLLCADMVPIEWTGDLGELRNEVALLEDISPLGLCLQTEGALPEGCLVLINLNGTQTRAMVRYCCWREIGYFTGLTFAPGSSWSSERFRPRHLTDPMILSPLRPKFIV